MIEKKQKNNLQSDKLEELIWKIVNSNNIKLSWPGQQIHFSLFRPG